MRHLIAAALLLGLTATGQAREINSDKARDIQSRQVFMKSEEGRKVDTGLKPGDFATDCDAKDGTPRWAIPKPGKVGFSCTMETEGDGNAGSAGVTTFHYDFVESGKDGLFLDRVTTSRGATLPPHSVVRHIRKPN